VKVLNNIEDADKEFLRIDASATNYLNNMIHDPSISSNHSISANRSTNEKPRRDISSTLQRISNLSNNNPKPKSIFTPSHSRQEEDTVCTFHKQKQTKQKALATPINPLSGITEKSVKAKDLEKIKKLTKKAYEIKVSSSSILHSNIYKLFTNI